MPRLRSFLVRLDPLQTLQAALVAGMAAYCVVELAAGDLPGPAPAQAKVVAHGIMEHRAR